MTISNTGIKKTELIFHILFWAWVIGGAVIFTDWVQIFFDHGASLIILTLLIPIYVNAFVLIPRYFKKTTWLKYAILIVLVIAIAHTTKAFLMAWALSASSDDFNFKTEFFAWMARDFQNLDRFLLSSTTTWILYLSFGYRFVRDWFVNQQETALLRSENQTLEKIINSPSEIKQFLSTATEFADKFSLKNKILKDYFFVNTGTERTKILLSEIGYIEGNGNYVTYHLADRKVLERSSIKETLAVLPLSDFTQIQRSFIVSLSHIDKIHDNQVYIGEAQLSIGPNYKEAFKKTIEKLSLRV